MHGRKMPATLRFMLASRRSELLGLEDLTRTCELVTRISQLVHALQKERGYSNIYLGGNAAHQRQQLDALSLEAEALERAVRQDLTASTWRRSARRTRPGCSPASPMPCTAWTSCPRCADASASTRSACRTPRRRWYA